MPLNKMDIIHAYKAMMTITRIYEVPVNGKYVDLEEQLLEQYDLNIHDMIGSMDHFYNFYNEIKDKK